MADDPYYRNEFSAWGVVCDDCGILGVIRHTRAEARLLAKEHRRFYQEPKPQTKAVRVVVAVQEATWLTK